METISPENVDVKLENKDLWDKFNMLGTEMVITKAGRRMFPFLQVSIKGLQPDEIYMVILDITKVDDRRYKYNERDNHWQIVDSRVLPPSPVGMYVHPLCPCRGNEICIQLMSFNKVKLTNNPKSVSFGHILLDSMGRYVPRLSIVTYNDYQNQRWQNGVAFMFEETEFIAVTTYMNKEITKLKIDNNPFARAFRENGLKGKGLQTDSTSSDANSIDFEKDQTPKEGNEAETPMSVTYFNNEESSNDDGIQVLHVNPSSIIVTDVLPFLPSTSSFMTSSNLPSCPTMSATSVTNVVFEPVTPPTDKRTAHTSSHEEEKTGLYSLLYPRAPMQSITVEMSQFTTGEKSGNNFNSGHGWAGRKTGDDNKEDILCKVTDVRSIRETPPSSPCEQECKTRVRSSFGCEENLKCLFKENQGDSGGKCEGSEAETTTKCLKYGENCLTEENCLTKENCLAEIGKLENKEMKCSDKCGTFEEENKSHIDENRNGDCWKNDETPSNNTSELTSKTIEIQDGCKSSTEEKLIHENTLKQTDYNGVNSTSDENVTRGNEECDKMEEEAEERKSIDSEKGKEQQNEKEMSSNTTDNEGNSPQGKVESGDAKESALKEDASKPQISKLVNFVNSVSMPVLKFGTERETISSHEDRNNNSVLTISPEKAALLRQKRPVDECPVGDFKKVRLMKQSRNLLSVVGQSKHSFKSLDQSYKRLMFVCHSSDIPTSAGQSKDVLVSVDQSDKRLRSVSHSSDIVKSVNQSEDRSKSVHRSNEITKKSSISISTLLQDNTKKEFCNEKSRLESNIQEQRANHGTARGKPVNKTGKGIPTSVINVGHEEPIKHVLTNNLSKLHQNSLHHIKYPEQSEGKERDSVSQGLNRINRNEHPSCLGGSNGIQQVVVDQNGALVETASTKSFPVILSTYSINPSGISNQQSIELNNKTRVDVSDYENRVPIVYPAENFYEENPDKEVLEKRSNRTERGYQGRTREVCGFSDKSNFNYSRTVPKPSSCGSHHTLEKPQEFIDLNSNMSANMYQRQAASRDHSYFASKGVPLQVVYTFETRMSLSRAPDPRLPEEYNPTRTTFTGYASNLICSAPPIAVTNQGVPSAASGKFY